MNVACVLDAQARDHATRLAMDDGQRRVTFAELSLESAHIAGQLRAGGVVADARALVLCPMSVTLYATLIAIWRLGAVAVFVDPSAGLRRLRECMRTVRPDVFIGVPRAHLLRLNPALARVRAFAVQGAAPLAITLRTPGRDDGLPRTPHAPVDRHPGAPAIVTFTSGSSGRPKALVRSHGFLLSQREAITTALGLSPGDRDLATLPMFVLASLAAGVSTFIAEGDLRRPDRVDGASVAAQVRRVRPTRLSASPAFVSRLLEAVQADDLGSLRIIHVGGAPVFPRLLRGLRERTNADVVAVYGSSEAEPIASLRWDQVTPGHIQAMSRGAGLLAGRPVPSIELRILATDRARPAVRLSDAEFAALILPPGSPGEIVVSGAHVLDGYLDGRDEESAKIRTDGAVWHRTGDAGYLDHEGRLWLLGRCEAVVRDAAGVAYPLAVECAAHELPGVKRSALVGHEGRRLLLVEPDHASAPPSLASMRQRLAWARLDEIRLVRTIPVDQRHASKIDYPALRRAGLVHPV